MNGGIVPSGYCDNYNTLGDTISISEGGNSCGHVNYNKVKFWSGGHNYTLHEPLIDNKFLFFSLQSKQEKIKQLRVGSGLPNIQKSRLSNFNVSYPCHVEAGLIAKMFWLINTNVLLHQRKVDK